jgi:D-glycero-alpha-D-manno-heptose-7-phosphate kinase
MFYTGEQRAAGSILADMRGSMQSEASTQALVRMVELVWELRDVLHSGELAGFGEVLHKNWLLKQQLSPKISNHGIEAAYRKGLANGATGGKLLGAGGNGFILFYCEKEKQSRLRSAFAGERELKFRFEAEGSKVIYVGEDEYEG